MSNYALSGISTGNFDNIISTNYESIISKQEILFLNNCRSNLQDQLDNMNIGTGYVTLIYLNSTLANYALISSLNNYALNSSLTPITNNISTLQSQVSNISFDSTLNKTSISGDIAISGNILANSLIISPIQLSYLYSVNKNIQTQFNDDASAIGGHTSSINSINSNITTIKSDITDLKAGLASTGAETAIAIADSIATKVDILAIQGQITTMQSADAIRDTHLSVLDQKTTAISYGDTTLATTISGSKLYTPNILTTGYITNTGYISSGGNILATGDMSCNNVNVTNIGYMNSLAVNNIDVKDITINGTLEIGDTATIINIGSYGLLPKTIDIGNMFSTVNIHGNFNFVSNTFMDITNISLHQF